MTNQTTKTPWPPNRWPTPAEWLDWLLSLPREEQLAAGQRVIEGAQSLFEEEHRANENASLVHAERVRVGRVRALCDEWDVLSKGETPTTRRIREVLR